jgi:hypothetical protein
MLFTKLQMSCYGVPNQDKHEKNHKVSQVTDGIAYSSCDNSHLNTQKYRDWDQL